MQHSEARPAVITDTTVKDLSSISIHLFLLESSASRIGQSLAAAFVEAHSLTSLRQSLPFGHARREPGGQFPPLPLVQFLRQRERDLTE